jgi:hypothetical protein
MEVEPVDAELLFKQYINNKDLKSVFNKTLSILTAAPSFGTLGKIRQLQLRPENPHQNTYSVFLSNEKRIHIKKISEVKISIITTTI